MQFHSSHYFISCVHHHSYSLLHFFCFKKLIILIKLSMQPISKSNKAWLSKKEMQIECTEYKVSQIAIQQSIQKLIRTPNKTLKTLQWTLVVQLCSNLKFKHILRGLVNTVCDGCSVCTRSLWGALTLPKATLTTITTRPLLGLKRRDFGNGELANPSESVCLPRTFTLHLHILSHTHTFK